MRGNTCCIARGSPSPDGRPARQVNPVSVRPRASDKARMVSWSSRFSKPEDAADLQAIFNGDDLDAENVSTLKRRHVGRSKLQKRFSCDSTLTNRRSQRPAAGNSEEEVARREELKRIRAKRLQEELGDICVYDEDATPLCSSPFGQTSKSPTDASDEDSQNDSVNAIINAYSSHRVDTGENQPLPSRKMAPDTPHRTDSALEEPKIPLPPVLNPKNMPNIDDTSIGSPSWRLSFTSPQRARCLRALSLSNPQYESTSKANLTAPTSDSLPSPGKKKKWLRGEVRRPLEAQHPGTASDELFSGIGSPVPLKAPATPLHEMQISQRLASAGTYIPPKQSSEYKDDEHVSPEEGFREINTRRSRYFRNVSGPAFSESKVPRAWGQVLGDGASSLHESGLDDSLEQTHGSSPGPELSLTIMQGQNIVPSYLQVPRIVISKPDELDGAKTLNRRHQQHSGEGYSSRDSESYARSPLLPPPQNTDADGYLKVPERSATGNPTEIDQPRPSTPLISKFSEDFDDPGSRSSFRSTISSAMRLSGLGRLTRSFDSEDSVNSVATEHHSGQQKAKHVKNGAPTRITSRKESLSLDRSKSSSMESAEIMWTKAFRQSIDGVSRGAEAGKRCPNTASKRSKLDGKATNSHKQRGEQTLTDETDDFRHSSRSTRSGFVIPPESWANFPSHSHESRCESTGPDDGVARSDLAIRELLGGLHKDAASAKKPQHKHQEESSRQHLPRRLTMKVRTSFDRLFIRQNKTSTDTVYGCNPSASTDRALGDLKSEIPSPSPRRGTGQKQAPIETSKPIYQRTPDAPQIPRRGSMDNLLERRGRGDSLLSPEERAKSNRAKRREKYKTWSGRDKSQMADMMALRQSTVDFMMQAQVMEKVERERALRAADEVLERSVVRYGGMGLLM